jgi:hypothetical protein
MSSTTRCGAQQGSDCALSSRRSVRGRSVLRSFLWGAFVAAVNCAIAAQAVDELATTGIYLLSGSGHQQGPFVGAYNLNHLLGSNRFYEAGLTGTSAVMANIEAGHIWTGHEALAHVGLIPSSPGATSEADRHSTWVALVMGGRPTADDASHDYQRGMAPDAQLFSGAIATGWPSNSSFPRYTASFFVNFSGISTYGPYRAAIATGVTGPGGTRTADVVNSSFVAGTGSGGLTATDQLTGTLDAMINEQPRTLLTIAAGNTLPSGEGPNRVGSPASGYNNLSVAALTANGGTFDLPSAFTNSGPNDYSDPTVGVASAARQVVDIAAPGEAFSTAYYGGQSGGNGPTLFGPPSGPAGGADWYTRNISGTSFSAPTAAGSAALLYDAAHTRLSATPDARDARVMKAVLLNSAAKTVGWDNGQILHPNGNGGVQTAKGLDDRVGAGRINLNKAYEQLLWGTTDVAGTEEGAMGNVATTGWDFGVVTQGTDNDYLINGILEAGSIFNGTLSWFRDRLTAGTTNYVDISYDNLDLELWEAVGGAPVELIAESKSLYNNQEHFSFMLPKTGQYLLRVRWTSELFDLVGDTNSEHYGLAWSVAVPEPETLLLLLVASAALVAARRSR